MQASKIQPGVVYAIKDDDDRLVRFRVTEVVTKRTKATGSPHDYESTVEGYIDIKDAEKGKPITRVFKPEAILGEYKAYAELVEREEAERVAQKAKADEQTALTKRLHEALYRIAGLEYPKNDGKRYDTPIRIGYGGTDIIIQFDAVEPLLKALEAVKESA
jgi:hypothetical protein